MLKIYFIISLFFSSVLTHALTTIEKANTNQDFQEAYTLFAELKHSKMTPDLFLDRLAKAKNSNYEIYIIRVNGTPVGMLGFSIINELYWGKLMHIDSLVVASSHRRQGYGTQLIKFAEKYARNMECTKIQVETGIYRDEAIAFYKTTPLEQKEYGFRIVLLN